MAFRRFILGRFDLREGLEGVSGPSSRSGRGPKLTRRLPRAMARLCLCGPQGTEFSSRFGRDGVCGTNDGRLDVGRGSETGAGPVVGGGSGTGAIGTTLLNGIIIVSVVGQGEESV